MIEKTGNDLLVIATQPQELAEAQTAIIANVREKEIEAQSELSDAVALIEQCAGAQLSVDRPTRLKKRAESRLLYLSKIRSALESGYAIVPNFPGTTIAVRVKKQKPNSRVTSGSWKRLPTVPDLSAEILPEGDGRYVNPRPEVDGDWITRKDENGREVTESFAYAVAFRDELGLPVDFLKPTVVALTGKCMARKLFDEIAIVDGVVRNRFSNNRSTEGDPLVIGNIIDRANRKRMSFLVAWFVDTATF